VLQRQLVENGIGPQKQSLIVAARSALQDEEFWSALGSGGLYTVVGRVGPWMSTVNEMGAGFATDYVRYLNRWPEAASFAAHDALCLLADAMERAPTLASSDLIAALEKSDMELTSGRITFPFGSQAAPESGGKPAWAWHQWMKPTQLFLQYTEVEQPAAQMAVIWSSDAAIVDGAVVRPNGE
jgi:hypothetical protein